MKTVIALIIITSVVCCLGPPRLVSPSGTAPSTPSSALQTAAPQPSNAPIATVVATSTVEPAITAPAISTTTVVPSPSGTSVPTVAASETPPTPTIDALVDLFDLQTKVQVDWSTLSPLRSIAITRNAEFGGPQLGGARI